MALVNNVNMSSSIKFLRNAKFLMLKDQKIALAKKRILREKGVLLHSVA
jgi:hypothetical protein